MAKWAIDNMEHTVVDGGVFHVGWSVSEVLHDITGVTYSAVKRGSLDFTPDPDAPSFIPFSDLTEGIVLTWVHDTLGVESVKAYEASLSADIADQKNPPTSTTIPWSQT
jgi:hypothetical protein